MGGVQESYSTCFPLSSIFLITDATIDGRCPMMPVLTAIPESAFGIGDPHPLVLRRKAVGFNVATPQQCAGPRKDPPI